MNTRKTLTDSYKQKKFRIGVFQIRNTANGKIYLDSSLNLDAIWNRHMFELNFGTHRNKALQEDWKAFGADSFVFEVLSELEQEDNSSVDYQREIKTLEAMFLEELQPFGDKGYHKKPA